MSHIVVLSDRVKELSYTTGTSHMALTGAATGFSSFGSYYAHNEPLFYAITDGTDYEVGSGVYQSAAYDAGDGITENQLVRFPMRSSNSHGLVDWTEGTKEIYVTYPATHSVYMGSGLGDFPAPQASGLAFWETSNILNYDNNIIWDSTNQRVGIGTGTPQHSIDIGGHGASSSVQASGFIVGTSGVFFPSGTSIPGYSGGRQIEHFLRNELDQSAVDAGLIGGLTGSSAVLELSGIVNQYIFFKQQNKGLVFAGPASGCEGSCSPAYPSFRFLTLEDIPDLSSLYVTTHDTASKSGVAIWHEDKIIGYDPLFIWNSGDNRLGINKSVPQHTIDVNGNGYITGEWGVGGNLTVGQNTTMSGNLQVRGNLDVVGDTTYIDSTTVTVLDKNLELGSLSGDARWTDAQIDGGGLILKSTDSTGDKIWVWKDSTDAWTTSGNIDVSGITGLTAGSGLTLTHNSNGQLLSLHVTDVFNINSNDSTEREITQDDKVIFKGVSGIATSTDISASNPNTVNVFFDPTELSGILNATATANDLTVSRFSDSAIVTESEGLRSSDNDTSLPTTAAVRDYADQVSGLLPLAGSGLILTSDNRFHFADPNSLTSMLDGDIVSNDQLLIFDDDPGVWKSVTIEELQDEIQAGNIVAAGSGLIIDGEKSIHLSDPANLTSMVDGDIVSSDQLLIFDDDPGVWKSVTIEELQDEMQGGNVITAGSGLVLDGEKQMHLDDPANLTSMDDGDIVASDQMLIFDDDAGKWKTVTIEELQDEIDTSGSSGGWFKYVDINDADSGTWGTSNVEAETDATLKFVAGSGIELGSRDATENAIRIYNTGMPYVSGMLVHASGALNSRITTVTDANTLLINASGAAISGWANNRYDANRALINASGSAISGWANNRYDANRALINASGAAISGWANNRYDTNATTFHASGHAISGWAGSLVDGIVSYHASGHAISGWAGTQFRTAGSGLTLHGVSMVLEDPDTDYDAVTASVAVGADQVLVWDDSDSRWKHMSLTEMSAEMLDSAYISEEEVDVATDYVLFLDGGVNGAVKKESWSDFAAKIAGTNIGSSNGQLTGNTGGAGGETNQNAWSYIKINGAADTTNAPTIDASEKTDTVDFSGVKGVEITSVTSSDSVVFSAAPASGWTNYLVAHSGAAISGWAGDQVAAARLMINASGAANMALINESGAAISGWASDRIDVNTGLINTNTSSINNLNFFKIVKVTDTDGGGWGTSDINADTPSETLSIVGGSGIELGTIDGTDNKLRIYNTGMPYVSGMLVHASGALNDAITTNASAITANTALVNASGAAISGWTNDRYDTNRALINASGASVSGYAASFGIFKTVEVDNTDTEYTWDDTTSVADAVTDTLKLVSGSGIELAADAELDSIRIYNTGMPYVSGMLVHASGALNDKIDGTANITATSGVIRVGDELRVNPDLLTSGVAGTFLAIGTHNADSWSNENVGVDSIMIGKDAGASSTGCNYINMIGYQAGFQADTNSESNMIGHQAGYSANDSFRINMMGYRAGWNATGCDYTNMIGSEVGLKASGCNYGNMIGFRAGWTADSCFTANMIGYYAGYQATGCDHASMLGTTAGQYASGCTNTSMIGWEAGKSARKVTASNIIGTQAGLSATGCQGANIIGHSAGKNAKTLLYSNMIGYGAGENASDATGGSMIGRYAGYQASGMTNSTVVGDSAGYESTGVNYSTLLGYQAGYNCSGVGSLIAIGESAGFRTQAYYNDNTGTPDDQTTTTAKTYSIAIGHQAMMDSVRQDNSIAIGRRALNESKPYVHNASYSDQAHYYGSSHDIAIGYETAQYSRYSRYNISMGYRAHQRIGTNFQDNLTGNNRTGATFNIAIGHEAGAITNHNISFLSGNTTPQTGNVFIGYKAGLNKRGRDLVEILGGTYSSQIASNLGDGDFNFLNIIAGKYKNTGTNANSLVIGDIGTQFGDNYGDATVTIKPKQDHYALLIDRKSGQTQNLLHVKVNPLQTKKGNANLNAGGSSSTPYIQWRQHFGQTEVADLGGATNQIVNKNGWLCVPMFDASAYTHPNWGKVLPKASDNIGMVCLLRYNATHSWQMFATVRGWQYIPSALHDLPGGYNPNN